jgi:CubicO group peptidase (beta-lactamase class C family)
MWRPAAALALVLALSLGSTTAADQPGDHGVDARSAAFPGARWVEAAPESRGLDPLALRAAVDFLKANAPRDGVDELVIVRRGALVWRGPEIDRVHGTWSCTKSFVSTVLGLLVDDGKVQLDTKVATALPSLAASYPDVTFRHLTTMTSGYRAEGDTRADAPRRRADRRHLQAPDRRPHRDGH